MTLGLLAVVGMPLGLVVVAVLVLRTGVRNGLRIGLAVAVATLGVAVLAYATGLAQLQVAGRLENVSSCDSESLCERYEREALDDTPIRSVGRWLVMAALADGALLALWWFRGPREQAGVRMTRVFVGLVGVASLGAVVVGAVAWQLPPHAEVTRDDLLTRTHLEQGGLGLVVSLVAVAGIVVAARLAPLRRPQGRHAVRAIPI